MAQPTKMKQWSVTSTDQGFDGLSLAEVPIPQLAAHEVLVKFHAVALNFRDLMIPRGDYPFPLNLPVVPCSDGAGEIVAVGENVTRWNKGDRVITLLNQAHLYGPSTPTTLQSGLGGSLAGTLREYGAFNEQGLVRAPKNLPYPEASTLCCAGVASWNALYGLRPLRPGQTVLVLGTGGVSLFALQFAKAAGATVIATTSSEEKAQKLRDLGADQVINYKEDPDWGSTARALSNDGQGVDHVVEVGGAGTLNQSMKALKLEGIMSVVGAVAEGGSAAAPSVLDCWLNNFVARGVAVGSREMMEEMVATVEANDLHPVLDPRVFTLQEAKEAYDHFSNRAGFGKTVIVIE